MRLHKIRSGDITKLQNKEYTICVGISLGNKWFTPDNIVALVKWSLDNSSNKVIVCPADDIHAINIQVRRRVSEVKALEIARKMSSSLMYEVEKTITDQFTPLERERVIYAVWNDLQTEEYKDKVRLMYEYFNTNESFRKEILSIVKSHTLRESRNYRPEDIEKFATYILEEFPEVSGVVSLKGITYDAHAYPYDGVLTQFIEDIQQGVKYQDIKEKIIGNTPKTFLEVR